MIDGLENFVLLETLRRDRDNSKNYLFANPLRVITCFSPSEILKCFQQLERYRRQGFFLAGFFSYELGYFLEDSFAGKPSPSAYPLLWFGVYEKPRKPPVSRLQSPDKRYYLTPPDLAISKADYRRTVGKIKNLIAQGETYQINFTSGYHFDFAGDVFDFYRQLKASQRVSYSALIRFGGNYLISLSPELFFRIDQRGKITVKPMKGTAPVDAYAGWLCHDPKNTSENVMIVDLLRNDLGRICKPGSVKVPELFTVEEYETLQQMTSTVTGRLNPRISLYDMMRSLFPCGSVTGAPKIQSMKIIRNLEREPRNIYTGAIGYFGPGGDAVFNVAIRTIDLQSKPDGKFKATMGVGSGIVFDSQPDEEYEECALKAKFLMNALPDFALIETMLCDNGKVSLLALHLRRLQMSAEYFSIPCAVHKIQGALKQYTARLTGKIRLRLLLKSNGRIVLEHQPLAATPSSGPVIALSGSRTKSDDIFLYHKTTQRKLYHEEHQRYSAKGFFDVIFRNEKDQITEGAISNIFVRIKGRCFTPPVCCGLLAGIGRETLMKKLDAREKILYLPDLKKADQILLTNSVRGVTEVRLKDGA